MLLKPIVAILGIALALSLLSPTTASAQRGARAGAGFHAGAFRGGAFRGGGFRGGAFRGGGFRGFGGGRIGPGAGFYPWGYDLYPWPYPLYSQPSCGYVRRHVWIHGRMRWRWVYRCY